MGIHSSLACSFEIRYTLEPCNSTAKTSPEFKVLLNIIAGKVSVADLMLRHSLEATHSKINGKLVPVRTSVNLRRCNE